MNHILAAMTLLLLVPATSQGKSACEALQVRVCNTTSDDCSAYLASKLVDPSGKPLSDINRLMACKLAIEDPDVIGRYEAEYAKWATAARFPFVITVREYKANGKAWDALGNAPDIAVCLTVDGASIGCVSSGTHVANATAKCFDSMQCEFFVKTHRGAMVGIRVVDVDASDNDFVAECQFTTGDDRGFCMGQATIGVGYVPFKDAGTIRDARLAADWNIADADAGLVDFKTLRFADDGRVIIDDTYVRRLGRYSIQSITSESVLMRLEIGDGYKDAKVNVDGSMMVIHREGHPPLHFTRL